MRFRGRRPRTGRFTRPTASAPPKAPLEGPLPRTPNQGNPLLESEPSGSRTSGHSQDSTAELPSLGGVTPSQADTSGDLKVIPDPPERVEFACPCGMRLVATRALYDRRSRCGACQSVLLLNLVYKRDLAAFEIEPFRVGPASGS